VTDLPNFGKHVSIEEEDQIRFDQVRKSIATRLKKACGHLPPDEFDALVDKMAQVQIGRRRL
jgi:hypothetical protein